MPACGLPVLLLNALSLHCLCVSQHVTEAAKGGAVDTLLLSDDLFRSPSVSQRRTYVELVETVKSAGGDVVIMSSLHVSGEQLSKLCGVAALLRYSVPLLEEEEEAEADSDSTDSESDEDDAADLFRVGDVGLPRGGAGADA